MQKLNKQLVLLTLMVMALQVLALNNAVAHAEAATGTGKVAINEIAWMGTPDGSNDEWIELYNTGTASVDLCDWYIEDDDGASTYRITGGEIPAHGYFVIADSEMTFSSLVAGKVIGVSLANSGDSLVLKDANGVVVDAVNSSGGAWYAGSDATKTSMERIDPSVSGDEPTNWAGATMGNGIKGRSGSDILGTPGTMNSNFAGAATEFSLELSEISALAGENVTLTGQVKDVEDLYAYGLEIIYDPTVVNFISAEDGDFLKKDGASTSFNYALKNGIEGVLVIGNARMVSPATGVDGAGELFTLNFKVVGENQKNTVFRYGAGSFLADSLGDIPVKFISEEKLTVEETLINSVIEAVANLGEDPYSLELKWGAPTTAADKYLIMREGPDGTFLQIGETTKLSFVDDDSAAEGGKLIPNVEYKYQIISVKNGVKSEAVTIIGKETRGIKGDNNRSGEVDGRDLENLARSFGRRIGNADYDQLTDTTFDGIADGSDLIDIGVNFGKVYK